jgi:SAM-dependent methyltransferase
VTRSGTIAATPNPIPVKGAATSGVATLTWKADAVTDLEVRVGAPDGPLFAQSGPSGEATTGSWVRHDMTFFLQDVSGGLALDASNTLATVTLQFEVPPPVGAVDFGDLRRVSPFTYDWGFARGRPIDRVYIERFFARHAADIKGAVVSIGDDEYAQRFGGERVGRSEVLDIRSGNPRATIVADLTDTSNIPSIPSNTFDCFLCPQTLQFVFDVRSAVHTIQRVLKPGGVALVTVPGLSQTYDPDWGDIWSWNFAPHSARRLFCESFPAANVDIECHGNALIAVSFLMGLVEDDLREDEFEHHQPGYEIVFTIRAVKA